MLVEPTEKRKAMFWEKVNIVDDKDSCWPWNAATNENGYGFIDVTFDGRQKRFYAHRISWEWENQSNIPEGLIVRHKCDNPPCVRPSHLEVGTHQDNTNDKMSRGRYGYRSTTITADIAVEIRERKSNGESTDELCRQYGLTKTHVNSICRGLYWPKAGGPLTFRFEISDSIIYSVLLDVQRMSYRAAAVKNGISYSAVQQIASGKKLPKSCPPTDFHHEALKDIKVNVDEEPLED